MTVRLIDEQDPLNRPRIFRREWKSSKPHLSKSTSLPTLLLAPLNRPLFTCQNCGSSNSYVPLCLWCTWTSSEVSHAFWQLRPRVRTLSAPSREFNHATSASDSTNRSSDDDVKEEEDDDQRTIVFSTNTSTTNTTKRTFVDCDDRPCFGTSMRKQHIRRVRPCPGRSLTSRSSPGSAASDGMSEVEGAAMDLGPDFPCTVADAQSLTLRHWPSADWASFETRPTSAPTLHQSCSQDFLSRTSYFSSNTLDSSAQTIAPSLSSLPGGSERTLRRKQRMVVMKKKSSCSLRSRASIPTMSIPPQTHGRSVSENISSASMSRTSTPSAITNCNSRSPFAEPDVRLGHPSRPYYTAIRKNMSRPSTPFGDGPFPVTPPRTPDPTSARSSVSVQRPAMSALSINSGENSDWPMMTTGRDGRKKMARISLPVPLKSTMGGGFSMSGEVELRMALARRRSEEEPNRMQEYKFHETPKKGSGSVKGRVRKLGKGLKDFMLGRS